MAVDKRNAASSENDYEVVDWMYIGPQVNGLPLLKPPYGSVVAIDLNAGDIAWKVPHGDGPRDHPAIKHLNLPPLGATRMLLSGSGPLVTKTLMFMNQMQTPGMALSSTGFFLRAFDKKSGKVLWEHQMDVAPTGVPMTYMHAGKQYVVVAVGGAGKPAQLRAFALPGAPSS
jgi:quinoprotein glucose dehydrogenase